MTHGRWRITVATPDWGQGHLSLDAIVAYVDDELDHGPYTRATRHLSQCRECAAQVVAQGQARAALRTAVVPSLPSSLLTSLRSIPQHADLPAPPAGLAMSPDGVLVSVLRPDRAAPLAKEPPAGTSGHDAHHGVQQNIRSDAHHSVHQSAHGDAHHDSHHDGRSHRRRRISTGVAVSGLAAGAIALAMPAAFTPETPVPASSNGVLGRGAGRAPVAVRRMSSTRSCGSRPRSAWRPPVRRLRWTGSTGCPARSSGRTPERRILRPAHADFTAADAG